MRLDENSEMAGGAEGGHAMAPAQVRSRGTRARPVTRRSISRELFEDRPKTMARPVTRRSVSKELFDVNFQPSANSHSRTRKDMQEIWENMRQQMKARERSMSREFDQFCMDAGFPGQAGSVAGPTHPALLMPDRNSRSVSLSRGGGGGGSDLRRDPISGMRPPSRPGLSSQGRSLTQNDFGIARRPLGGPSIGGMGSLGRSRDDDGLSLGRNGLAGLEDRGRSDWRRISVPERGKDFKSLPRKYNR